MKSRSQGRETAFKILYEAQLRGDDAVTHLEETLAGHSDDTDLVEFTSTLITGCRDKDSELTEMIQNHAAHWDPKRLATTDRVILQMGLFEMAFLRQPAAVVIDEAIELAKTYGGKESPSFINGILDSWNKANA